MMAISSALTFFPCFLFFIIISRNIGCLILNILILNKKLAILSVILSQFWEIPIGQEWLRDAWVVFVGGVDLDDR